MPRPSVNAVMKRTIVVLQDDIDQGCRKTATNCAIARAASRDLADILTEADELSVCSGLLSVLRKMPGLFEQDAWVIVHSADMPAEASEFVAAFDAGWPVQPFKFEIDLQPAQYTEEIM